jgi:hypothetical protein
MGELPGASGEIELVALAPLVTAQRPEAPFRSLNVPGCQVRAEAFDDMPTLKNTFPILSVLHAHLSAHRSWRSSWSPTACALGWLGTVEEGSALDRVGRGAAPRQGRLSRCEGDGNP